jgi:uncharacterized membrane protein
MTLVPGPTQLSDERRAEMRLNRLISRVLQVGLLTGLTLLAAGVILNLVRSNVSTPHSASFTDVAGQLARLEAGGFYDLGALVLLATPVAAIAVLGFVFARRRQWLFAGISAAVILVLVLSGVLALTLG